MIRNVYMTGKIDDYCVLPEYPNVHLVLESGEEVAVPVYSPRMYLFCGEADADSGILAKINELYAKHMKMLREAPEGTAEHYAWHSIAVRQDLEGRMRLAEDLTKKVKVRETAKAAAKSAEAAKAAVKKAEEARTAAKNAEEARAAEKKVEEAKKEEEKKIEEARIAAKKVEEVRKEEEKKVREAWLAKKKKVEAKRAKKG